MDVEFTDRYGGKRVHLLTICRPCEGMGAIPGRDVDDDFRRCRECLGTGKTNWAVALIRIPGQIRSNCRFLHEMAFRWDTKPSSWSKFRHLRAVIKIAFTTW